MTFNITPKFNPFRLVFEWGENGNASAEIEALKNQIAELKTMSEQARIKAAIAQEQAEHALRVSEAVAEALRKIIGGEGITKEAADQVIAEVATTVTGSEPPSAGRFNYSITKISSGGTERRQQLVFNNEDIGEGFKAALDTAWDTAKAGAAAQPAGGGVLNTIIIRKVQAGDGSEPVVDVLSLDTIDPTNAWDASGMEVLAAGARSKLPAA